MKIKEVEKLTGLTAKAIRLYESKGLLTVARLSENDYRDYTQEDVERLKTIAFLRTMDISISSIKDWVDGKLTLQDLMRYSAGKADGDEEAARLRGELAREALKLMQADPELDLMTAMEEVKTLRELKREMDSALEQWEGNLIKPVVSTVIALGPVGWTFINIHGSRVNDALFSFALSIPAVLLAAFQWARYFRISRNKRTRSGCLPALMLAVLGFCSAIGMAIFVSVCQEALFTSGEDALVLFRQPWVNLLLIAPIADLFLMFKPAIDKTAEWKLGWKGWVMIAVCNMVVLYGGITGVTVCTSEGFQRHSFFDPLGTSYSREDIDRVEAGFHGLGSALVTGYETGDFYYKITFSDGTTENWSDCAPANDDADPWEALELLDAWIMSADVEKISSEKNRDRFMYDQECLDVCDAILNNP